MKVKKQGWIIIYSEKYRNTWALLTEDIFSSEETAQKYLKTGDWLIRTPSFEFNIIHIEWEAEEV